MDHGLHAVAQAELHQHPLDVAAFSSSSPVTDLKMMATGLAAGILLDATVIQALIVPP